VSGALPIALVIVAAAACLLTARSVRAKALHPIGDRGDEPAGLPAPGDGAACEPYQVLCTYLVRPERVDELRALLRRHWPLLREHGFVTEQPAQVYFGEDGSGPFFVEIMTWVDPRASSRAYHNEEVNAIWNDLYLFTESRGSRPAIEYPQVELEHAEPAAHEHDRMTFGRIGLWM
jgi:hypothetical protein